MPSPRHVCSSSVLPRILVNTHGLHCRLGDFIPSFLRHPSAVLVWVHLDVRAREGGVPRIFGPRTHAKALPVAQFVIQTCPLKLASWMDGLVREATREPLRMDSMSRRTSLRGLKGCGAPAGLVALPRDWCAAAGCAFRVPRHGST